MHNEWLRQEIHMSSIKNKLVNESGIYKLGFDLWSFLGVALPVGFVVVVGGVLGYLVTR